MIISPPPASLAYEVKRLSYHFMNITGSEKKSAYPGASLASPRIKYGASSLPYLLPDPLVVKRELVGTRSIFNLLCSAGVNGARKLNQKACVKQVNALKTPDDPPPNPYILISANEKRVLRCSRRLN